MRLLSLTVATIHFASAFVLPNRASTRPKHNTVSYEGVRQNNDQTNNFRRGGLRLNSGKRGDDAQDINVNEQILYALESQYALLKNIDERLDRIERAGLGGVRKDLPSPVISDAIREGLGIAPSISPNEGVPAATEVDEEEGESIRAPNEDTLTNTGEEEELSSQTIRSDGHNDSELSREVEQIDEGVLVKDLMGSWSFVESPELIRRKDNKRTLYEAAPTYGVIEDDDPSTLRGGFFNTPRQISRWVDAYAPDWSKSRVRVILPQLALDGNPEIEQKSGIYTLDVRYNIEERPFEQLEQEAGIIIGGMEFNSEGYVMADGADWDVLLNNQPQTQLPFAYGNKGVSTWLRRKIVNPWKDGDLLHFTIDTTTNTVSFRNGNAPEMSFRNALTFTNNRQYPMFVRVFAYCGHRGSYQAGLELGAQLTIVPERIDGAP